MKKSFKLVLKNCDILTEDAGVIIYEKNAKDETLFERPLNEVFDEIDGKENLKISIATSNEMSSEAVKSVLEQFIDEKGLNISIENSEEL